MDTTSLHVRYMIKKDVAHIRNIEQALKHSLKLKKVRMVIAFYQEAWLRPYIEMNTEFRKSVKRIFTN